MMIPEAERLLELIGSNEEIGTHASVSGHHALAFAINRGEDSYGVAKGFSLNINAYRQAMIDICPILGQMSTPAFQRLIHFAGELGFTSDRDVGMAIKRSYALSPRYEEQVPKRAIFLQGFAKVKPPLYTADELRNESQVREKDPWAWIDAVLPIDISLAREETLHQINDNKNKHSFNFRIAWLVANNQNEYLDSVLAGVKDRRMAEVLRRRIERSRKGRDSD